MIIMNTILTRMSATLLATHCSNWESTVLDRVPIPPFQRPRPTPKVAVSALFHVYSIDSSSKSRILLVNKVNLLQHEQLSKTDGIHDEPCSQ